MFGNAQPGSQKLTQNVFSAKIVGKSGAEDCGRDADIQEGDMGEIYYYYYQFDICRMEIAESGGKIVRVQFAEEEEKDGAPGETDSIFKETPLIAEAAKQLEEYFAGKRREFELPLGAKGTEFQKKVWEILKTIPYGETRSYGEIAALAGNPKASRAVGMANNRNPIAIIVPCHRVIGKSGSLTGYAGGLAIKAGLLELEKRNISAADDDAGSEKEEQQ